MASVDVACNDDVIEHTLFLGCSVRDFKCSLGWNTQASSLTVNLVEDTCEHGERVYYDVNLNRQTRTGADPGFRVFGGPNGTPELGAPCYFRYGNFEFTGILQTWKKSEVASDTNIYEVILTAPTEILSGTNLILSDYAGTALGFNVFNIYGLHERGSGGLQSPYTQNAWDGVTFGSVAGGYGGADKTDAGMPWGLVRNGITLLTSSYPQYFRDTGTGEPSFSQYGRVNFTGASIGGYGLLRYDRINVGGISYAGYVADYYVDISDVPYINADYRIGGTNVDILTVVNQVCQDISHDFYVELIPVRFAGGIAKIIKFRTVSRTTQPPTDAVASFILQLSEKGVISSEFGKELRNESNTNFIIGGQKRSMYQVANGAPLPGDDPDDAFFNTYWPNNTYVRDTIVPYYGKDFSGDVYVEFLDANNDNKRTINVDMRGLASSLDVIGPLLPTHVNVTVEALSFTGGGGLDWFSRLKWDQSSDLFAVLANLDTPVLGLFSRAGGVPANASEIVRARDLIDSFNLSDPYKGVTKDLLKIKDLFAHMYQTSITNSMVRVPFTNAKIVNNVLETSDSPAEGGWTENPDIIGLANPGGIVDYFKNSDGSIASIALFKYADNLNIDKLDSLKSHFITTAENPEGLLYTEVTVDSELVFLDKSEAISPRCVVSIPDLGEVRDQNMQETSNNGVSIFSQTEASKTGAVDKDHESRMLKSGAMPVRVEPFQLALAFQSNENTYGPWTPNNIVVVTPPGKINVQKDESLVPWPYGSYNGMNLVAQAMANSSVGGMNVGESGSLQIDSYPALALGAELLSGSSVIEDRITNTTMVPDDNLDAAALEWKVGPWTNASGPNITAIDVQFSTQGITTTYTFRTFSPKFGKLSKYNADRMGNNLREANKIESRRRYFSTRDAIGSANTRRRGRAIRGSATDALDAKKSLGAGGDQHNAANRRAFAEPASVMIGETFDWTVPDVGQVTPTADEDQSSRTTMGTGALIDLGLETSNDGYNKKAIMSWDGLIRPVSLAGSGGLTPMIKGSSTVEYDTASSATNSIITNKYFNFLSNPTGEFSELSGLHDGDRGHDIDIVARRTVADYTGTGEFISHSLVLPTNIRENNDLAEPTGEYFTDYADDYRFHALRGPLWIQGWGYDTDGKPVPNEADTLANASQGIFATAGLTNKFMPDFLNKSKAWPSAPVDIRLDREKGLWVAGSGSGGGSGLIRYVVLEDLTGLLWETDTDGYEAVSLQCALLKRNGGRYEVDFASGKLDVEILGTAAISLASSECGGASPENGLIIDKPVMVNNRVVKIGATGGQEDENVIVTGSGVDPQSSVTVKFWQNGSQSAAGNISASVEDDGTWSIAATDISDLLPSVTQGAPPTHNGAIVIEAHESDISGFDEKDRLAFLTYATLTTSQNNGAPPTPTVAPDLTYETDLGTSNIDDRTSDTTPTFTGPASSNNDTVRLYANGSLVATGLSDANSTWELDSTTLVAGNYDFTYTLETEDGWQSGHSPVLTVAIDPSATAGEIRVVSHSDGAFTVGTSSILLKTGAIVTGPTPPDLPTAPTHYPNPSPGIAGSDNTELVQIWIDGAWVPDGGQGSHYRLGWGRLDNGVYTLEGLDNCRIKASAQLAAFANGTEFSTAHAYADADYVVGQTIGIKHITLFTPDGTTPLATPVDFGIATIDILENESLAALFNLTAWELTTNDAGYPTAACYANGAYLVGDARIDVKDVSLSIPDGVGTPTTPTDALQATPAIGGINDDNLQITYDGNDWSVD